MFAVAGTLEGRRVVVEYDGQITTDLVTLVYLQTAADTVRDGIGMPTLPPIYGWDAVQQDEAALWWLVINSLQDIELIAGGPPTVPGYPAGAVA